MTRACVRSAIVALLPALAGFGKNRFRLCVARVTPTGNLSSNRTIP